MTWLTVDELKRVGTAFQHSTRVVVMPDGRIGVRVENPRVKAQLAGQPVLYNVHGFATEWARYSFPTVQMSHTYAAALMSTSVPDVDIRPPWPAFLLMVPNGLVTILNRTHTPEDVTFMLVLAIGDRWSFIAPGATVEWSQFQRNLAYLRADELDELVIASEVMLPDGQSMRVPAAFGLETENHDERANTCLTRLMLNACVAMSDPSAMRPIGKGHRKQSGARAGELPLSRVYDLSRPVRVDCRDAVRAFVGGHRSSLPTVRWLVRGHWRKQAHGTGRSMRTMKWIEPFWKGDADAPKRERPHVVIGDVDGSTKPKEE